MEKEITDTIVIDENEPAPLQTNNTGSRIPFNVVMLKSDKEKMEN